MKKLKLVLAMLLTCTCVGCAAFALTACNSSGDTDSKTNTTDSSSGKTDDNTTDDKKDDVGNGDDTNKAAPKQLTAEEWKKAIESTISSEKYSITASAESIIQQTIVKNETTTTTYGGQSYTENIKFSTTEGVYENNTQSKGKSWIKVGDKVYTSTDMSNEVESVDKVPDAYSYNDTVYYVISDTNIYCVSFDEDEVDTYSYKTCNTTALASEALLTYSQNYSFTPLSSWIKLDDMNKMQEGGASGSTIDVKSFSIADAFSYFTYDAATDTYVSTGLVLSYLEEINYDDTGFTIKVQIKDGKLTSFIASLEISGDGSYSGSLQEGVTGKYSISYNINYTISCSEPTFDTTELKTVNDKIADYKTKNSSKEDQSDTSTENSNNGGTTNSKPVEGKPDDNQNASESNSNGSSNNQNTTSKPSEGTNNSNNSSESITVSKPTDGESDGATSAGGSNEESSSTSNNETDSNDESKTPSNSTNNDEEKQPTSSSGESKAMTEEEWVSAFNESFAQTEFSVTENDTYIASYNDDSAYTNYGSNIVNGVWKVTEDETVYERTGEIKTWYVKDNGIYKYNNGNYQQVSSIDDINASTGSTYVLIKKENQTVYSATIYNKGTEYEMHQENSYSADLYSGYSIKNFVSSLVTADDFKAKVAELAKIDSINNYEEYYQCFYEILDDIVDLRDCYDEFTYDSEKDVYVSHSFFGYNQAASIDEITANNAVVTVELSFKDGKIASFSYTINAENETDASACSTYNESGVFNFTYGTPEIKEDEDAVKAIEDYKQGNTGSSSSNS
jgi:hypothetical protein